MTPKIIEHQISYPDSPPYILTIAPDGGLRPCDSGAGHSDALTSLVQIIERSAQGTSGATG